MWPAKGKVGFFHTLWTTVSETTTPGIVGRGVVMILWLIVLGYRCSRPDTMKDSLPTGSEERGILGSIPDTIFPSCQDVKIIALDKHEYNWVLKIRNTSEAVLRPQYTPLGYHTDCGPMGLGQ